MIAIGLDPSIAHCGLAMFDDDRLAHVEVFVSKASSRLGDTQARTAEMLDWAEERTAFLGNSRSDVIAIEWPIATGRRKGGKFCPACKRPYDAGTAATGQTFAAAGALVGALRRRAGTLLAPAPTSWRSALATKGETTEALLRRLDRTYAVSALIGKTNGPHGIDAVGLALFGQQQIAAERAA